MKTRSKGFLRHGLVVVLILLANAACRTTRTADEKQAPLPARVPERQLQSFTGPENGWPPRPKDMTDVREETWVAAPSELSQRAVDELVALALADADLLELLGSRFTFTHASSFDDKQGEPTTHDLYFYSYSNNMAVQVIVDRGVVRERNRMKGYQPAETRAEIELAIRMAANDPRLRGKVEDMEGVAMITETASGNPGYGNRLLWVCFTRGDKDLPDFVAMVDLITEKVLQAGSSR